MIIAAVDATPMRPENARPITTSYMNPEQNRCAIYCQHSPSHWR